MHEARENFQLRNLRPPPRRAAAKATGYTEKSRIFLRSCALTYFFLGLCTWLFSAPLSSVACWTGYRDALKSKFTNSQTVCKGAISKDSSLNQEEFFGHLLRQELNNSN